MATIAINTAVTTCPCPRSLKAPNADIGATGCSTIIPYKIKSQSVNDLRSPAFGPAFSVLKQLSSTCLSPKPRLLNRFKSLIVRHPAARLQAVSSAESFHPSTLFPHTCPFVQLNSSHKDGIFSLTHCN